MRRWAYRLVSSVGITVVIGFFVFWLLVVWPRRDPHPPLALPTGTLAMEHIEIYTSPAEAPIADGSILIRDGRIAEVGTNVAIPPGTPVLACDHCTVTAGFWNSHVHFTQGKWAGAEWQSAAKLNAQLADMLTSRGFTTVVDTGSNLIDTIPIRRRMETGNLDGPFIYTAGGALYPPHGIPFYLRDTLPKWLLLLLAQPDTPQRAAADVQRNLDAGADITKLFTGSWVERGHVLPMPLDIAKAAVERSHLNGRLVFAHPSNLAGMTVAIQSGVDVLAHAADDTNGVDRELLSSAIQHHMAMIPTLKMFGTTVTTKPGYLDPIFAEVRQFHELGGMLIFGTDVGYMSDYTTDYEFTYLGKSGLSSSDILAMLTTNPAARFGVSQAKGTISPGKLADLTVLAGDPGKDAANFAKVRMTIRSGRVIYRK
jgi:imidazolonepropionase-like amidohydrolase